MVNENILPSAELIKTIVAILTLIVIYATAIFAKKSLNAQTYFKIVSDINTQENMKNVDNLKKLLKKGSKSKKTRNKISNLMRLITNRYEVVAHIAERNFIDKNIILENFSGTFLEIYSLSISYIRERRASDCNSLYLRRISTRINLYAMFPDRVNLNRRHRS